MRVPRLYLPQALSSGTEVSLEAASAHYLTRVLRLQVGREVRVFNGEGGEFLARITAIDKKFTRLHIGDFDDAERESHLTINLAIGISRGERMDWVLQKATELGVSRVTPLFTERGEVRLKEDRLEKKVLHWQQILVSACEQCQRNRLPLLDTPTTLQNWLPTSEGSERWVLHHRSSERLPTVQPPPPQATLLIGPEGGLSAEEIDAAIACGFKALTLGPRVLRTETAPIAAISIMQYLWGDLA